MFCFLVSVFSVVFWLCGLLFDSRSVTKLAGKVFIFCMACVSRGTFCLDEARYKVIRRGGDGS